MTLPDAPDGAGPIRPVAAGRIREGSGGVAGNERLTALAGAILLALILVELVTTVRLHALISVHVFVGVLLAGPLVIKFGSTGYRFVRYYTRSPAYVRRGPPRLALRVLAPALVVTTVTLIGSGIGLLVVGPGQETPLLRLHALSTLIWIPLLAIHAVAYFPRVPHLVTEDWSAPSTATEPRQCGRELRLSANVGALLGGVIAAILLLPVATPWNSWIMTNGNNGPAGPLVVGLLIAALALLMVRPLRWK